MATDEWPTARPLVDLLEFEPYRFEFDQAVRLIEMLIEPAVGLADVAEPSREAVKLRSEMEFGFPASVVRNVKLHRNRYGVLKKGEIRAALFGLAGVLGPLPLAFTDILMDRRAQRDNAMADFLDIFNHRLLSILHKIRERSRVRVQWRHPIDQPVARYLLSIAGLGTDGTRDRMGRSKLRQPVPTRRASGGRRRAAASGSASQQLGLGPDGAGSGGISGFDDDSASTAGLGGGFRSARGGPGDGDGGSGTQFGSGFGGDPSGPGGTDWDSGEQDGSFFSSEPAGPGEVGWEPYDVDGTGWDGTQQGVPDACMLFYSLHLGSRPSSISGLESMLSDFFGVTVGVRGFKGRWFDLDPQERTSLTTLGLLANKGLGANNQLGLTASLGSRAYDAGGGFDLEVHPKTQEMLDDFLPGAKAHDALARLTRLYVGAGPEFGVVIKANLPGRKAAGLSLKNLLRLGWTARINDSEDFLFDPTLVTETVIKIQKAQE